MKKFYNEEKNMLENYPEIRDASLRKKPSFLEKTLWKRWYKGVSAAVLAITLPTAIVCTLSACTPSRLFLLLLKNIGIRLVFQHNFFYGYFVYFCNVKRCYSGVAYYKCRESNKHCTDVKRVVGYFSYVFKYDVYH